MVLLRQIYGNDVETTNGVRGIAENAANFLTMNADMCGLFTKCNCISVPVQLETEPKQVIMVQIQMSHKHVTLLLTINADMC